MWDGSKCGGKNSLPSGRTRERALRAKHCDGPRPKKEEMTNVHSNSSGCLLCLRHSRSGVLGVRCRGGRALCVLSRPGCALREQPDATRRQVPCQVEGLRHNRARTGRGHRRTFDGTPGKDCPCASPGGSSASPSIRRGQSDCLCTSSGGSCQSPSKRRGYGVSVDTSIR